MVAASVVRAWRLITPPDVFYQPQLARVFRKIKETEFDPVLRDESLKIYSHAALPAGNEKGEQRSRLFRMRKDNRE